MYVALVHNIFVFCRANYSQDFNPQNVNVPFALNLHTFPFKVTTDVSSHFTTHKHFPNTLFIPVRFKLIMGILFINQRIFGW